MDTVTLQRLAELSAMAGHEREQELEAIVRIIATATKEELEILDIVLSNGDAKLRDIVSSSMQQRRKKLTFYIDFQKERLQKIDKEILIIDKLRIYAILAASIYALLFVGGLVLQNNIQEITFTITPNEYRNSVANCDWSSLTPQCGKVTQVQTMRRTESIANHEYVIVFIGLGVAILLFLMVVGPFTAKGRGAYERWMNGMGAINNLERQKSA